jgi:hypothetical protein
VDQRVRPRCEQFRTLLALVADDKASIDDVYQAVSQQTPTWTDNRTDGPPHLLVPNDVLSFNTVISCLTQIRNNTFVNDADRVACINALVGQMPVVLKSCVRPLL